MNRRRILTAGVVLAAVATGGVAGAVLGIPGLSGASTSSTAANAPDARPHFRGFGGAFGAGKGVLDAAAKALGMSTDELMAKLSDGTTTIADVAKAQTPPVDVNTVIDAMDAVAKSDITDLVNNPFPVPPKFDPNNAPKGPMAGGRPGFGGPRLEASLDVVAKALGITTDELRTDLGNGQSIADIAKAKSVNLDTLITTLVDDAKSKLDAAVKDGKVTQDRATKLEANLKDRITNVVNNTRPKGLRRMGRFGHGGPGFGGPDGLGGPPLGAPMPSTTVAPTS